MNERILQAIKKLKEQQDVNKDDIKELRKSLEKELERVNDKNTFKDNRKERYLSQKV